MSVVGPRPALPNEVATYNDYQRQRLLVKPGMTCYWQTRRNRDWRSDSSKTVYVKQAMNKGGC